MRLTLPIFLVISKYGNGDKRPRSFEVRRAGREVCGHVLGDGERAAVAHHATSSDCSSRRAGGCRDSGGSRDPELHALASSRQTQERGLGRCAARGYVSSLYREYRSVTGTAAISLRRVLYTQ